MSWLADPETWLALGTLTALEIVLGIDNIIFISILASKLPKAEQPRARFWGLAVALGTRLLLLFSLAWLMGLTTPLITILAHEISGRDIILLLGGLFLLGKSTLEIHEKLEGEEEHGTTRGAATFGAIIVQIALLDIVFSLDSVITAVGMANQVSVMATAIVIAVLVMMAASGAINEFIDQHPTIKMLALSFLLLVGVMLIGEGLHFHIPKGYIYFAMAFSVFVEMLNTKIRRRRPPPVKLRQRYAE
ncbi:TerC family protein [Candidatus Nitronereus thalassa]|uniref:TerC family protein n=1 Tax=Candidatus Nitronereus thalassa TaxID=3020898 RepID=A0ABU3KCC5_9BACT|nr:TerC family protein [Candidatus Nitronereus thalassa]MDT7044091.1 TerC family protein [Candidatus Nitronereus thalassa]